MCTVAEKDKVKVLIFVFGSFTLSLGGDLFRPWEVCVGGGGSAWASVTSSDGGVVSEVPTACQQDTVGANGECPSAGRGGSPSTQFCNHV